MCRITLLVTILYLSLHHANQNPVSADKEKSNPNNHFDILAFAQEWPVTICKDWIHETGGQCVFPKQKNRWTVHGIWPRQVGVNYTEFCNTSWTFDPEEIKSIVPGKLDQAWINTYKETEPYSFWKHEWDKHGTCATDLESLNSEFKYFSQAIEWNLKYSLSDMLEAANIFPSDTKEFNPEEFPAAVEARTKKSSMVGCYVIDGVVYVQELRICFDKHLNLIDCERPAVDLMCKSLKGVIYPANAR